MVTKQTGGNTLVILTQQDYKHKTDNFIKDHQFITTVSKVNNCLKMAK
jgi:hypothetical protein